MLSLVSLPVRNQASVTTQIMQTASEVTGQPGRPTNNK